MPLSDFHFHPVLGTILYAADVEIITDSLKSLCGGALSRAGVGADSK